MIIKSQPVICITYVCLDHWSCFTSLPLHKAVRFFCDKEAQATAERKNQIKSVSVLIDCHYCTVHPFLVCVMTIFSVVSTGLFEAVI